MRVRVTGGDERGTNRVPYRKIEELRRDSHKIGARFGKVKARLFERESQLFSSFNMDGNLWTFPVVS